MANPPKLTPLGELFAEATRIGVDEWGLASRLLKELSDGLTAFGYRRHFTFPDGYERRERLPRDTHRQPIPNYYWHDFEAASPELESKWTDDPDDPEASSYMDWVSGHYESYGVETYSFDTLQVHFDNIAIERKAAERILAELKGKPRKSAGAPKGPRNAPERDAAKRGLEMIRGGDDRPIMVIAADLVDRHAEGDEVRKQKLRIANGIRALMVDAENSAPK